MSNFFRHTDFRLILKELVEQRKEGDRSFSFTALAQALGVQRTYLSKVMSGGATLSTDQLFLLTEFFALSKEQHDYLVLLIEHERTGLARRKKILQQRIAAIQLQSRSPKKAISADFVEAQTDAASTEYYLDPFMTIFHLSLMLPQFGGDAEKVAGSLGLQPRHAKKIVSALENLGIIAQAPGKKQYRVLKDHLQLSPDSPVNSAYYGLMRLASAQQLMKIPRDQRCVYSVSFAADEATRAQVHEAFLKFLREIEAPIRKAPAHGVYQMNFDLFPWK